MPEWLFALILLVVLCGLGVYITKGIEGFTALTRLPMNVTPSSERIRLTTPSSGRISLNTPSSGLTSLNDLNTDFLQYAYTSFTKTPTSIQIDPNSPYLHSPSSRQLQEAQSGNGLAYDDASSNQAMYESETSYKGPWSDGARYSRQTGTPISVRPSDFNTEAETIATCAPVRPALRDLIRSDMDEAVNALVEKEVLQLQNKYALS
jgi:hypothetical protein